MIIALLISLFLLLGMPLMGQTPLITLPEDGNWPTIVGDSIMLIGPKQEALTEEQRYFNPPYLMVYPGKEHLKEQMIRAALCDCDPTKPNRRIGVFSVAPDKQVSFSQGNLQYLPSLNIWKFANTQYEYLGNANKYLKPTFRNWVDLFGWSANNTTAPFGVSTSTNVTDYAGTFVDWGTNTICGDAPNTWRTLSADEWEYLFEKRKNALQLRSKGSIDGHRGHVLLPDNWVLPEGVQFVAQPNNLTMDLDINSYTQAEWSIMEKAGAVFLPAAGRRDGTTVGYLVEYSGVWSSTSTTNTNAFHTYYNYESQIIQHHWTSATSRINGRSVRLVHDTIVPETIPEPCLVVKVNDTLSINMMCVEGGTFRMGAMESDKQAHANEKPAHQVTLTYDYYIGQTEVTQALWKAVMGNNPSTMIGDDLPVNNVLWEEADAFVKRLSQMTGYTFHLPTEAEWEFAARGGNKSQGYLYAGSNNIQEVAWYGSNSGNTTQPVGTKQPNELGIYDMSGNVIEWCSDWLGPYSAEAQVNPIGPATGAYHVYCGGCWYLPANVCRCTHRRQTTAGYGEAAVGLRVALREKVEPEAVDMGLSVKWANFNIGAFHPTHCGNYFAWGETEPKDKYSWATYKWCQGTANTLTKYCSNGQYGNADYKTILDPEDDAAIVHWGSDWRMPTIDEWLELKQKCSWKKIIINGITGYQVTAKNGNSIFLPRAGLRMSDILYANDSVGYYASSNHLPEFSHEDYASYMLMYDNSISKSSTVRYYGLSIRPVYDDVPDPCLVVKVNDTLSINMMCVEGGTFMMGATPEMDPDALAHEAPVHSVTLSDYYIGQIEVTQALWKTVMGTNPSTIKDNNRPVNNVSWEDCQVFIEKLNQKTGYSFRLPTEAEWEYAARGGNKSRGYKYAGSDNIDEVAWYKDNSGGKYQPFALKKPNELGIYDMSGNVFEWCQDWYGPYSADAQVNPQGPESGPYHMIRGGGWKHIQSNRVTYRRTTGANLDITSIGLRLVLHDTVPTPPEPEYVDLGLSVKWATFNVGASKPEDYGDYFAWGETEPKEEYTWENYKWCDGTDANITKYNSADGKTILEPADDAAQVHWGGKWRMPSDEEFTELREKCTWTWTTQDGVKGYKITGPSGNSIFIPAAGFHYENGFNYGENGDYWSAQAGLPNNGKHLNFYPNKQINSTSYRYFGFPIRPVYDDRPTLTVIPTPEDAKVSFLCIGYQAQGHSITVDKGKNVLYQVSNVDAGYLSQGDSIYNLTKDTTLYVTLRPFSDGNWVKVDKSEYTKQEGYYVSRNNGGFASHSVWNYYVLPVLPGETYRVRGIAGQHAALWMAASTAPDPATNTRPTKISCCANRGVAAYVADEVTIPDGAKYLIINSRNGKEMMVERKVPDPCLAIKVNGTLSINLMCVEGGTFTMGAMEGDTQAKENEKPAHEVTLTYDYHIMQTEVTQGLWEAVMGEDIYDLISKSPTPTAKPISTKGDFPVGYVQLSQCLEFIDRLNALTGLHFRMPTEAEWEYAARGGNKSKGYLYAGSNTLTQVAQTSLGTVAKLLPNELGIYDMSGNIAEMTLDYLPNHETGYPSANAQVNPRQISPTGNRAIRGLRWNTTEINCRISHRNAYTTTYSGNGMGFRLVLSEEQDFRTIHVNGSYFDMSFVKGGTFMMGSDAGDAQADEQPVHEVTLSDYYIGQTEVTQHLWQKVMGDDNNPSATKGNNLPVTNITWDEAQVFVQKLSEMTGLHFRLPTEAEWEYAARGGQRSQGYTYAGSDNIDQVGWYNGNSSNKTHAVGQKQPNELGIYDMTGNIWEYCFDWHTPYAAQAQTNPKGATTGEKHVLRGGCYHYDSKNCTNTNRHSYYTPDKGGASTGLRIVLEVDK